MFQCMPPLFIENIFRSGLTLVSSNDIITKKYYLKKIWGCKMDIRETNSDYEMGKR